MILALSPPSPTMNFHTAHPISGPRALRLRLIVCFAPLFGTAGCQTTEQYRAEINRGLDARLSAYRGATVEQFTARTGMVPINAYPAIDSRVFVFERPPIYLTLPATNVTPAVTRSAACQLLVRTVNSGAGGTADDWKIVGTQWSRPCSNLQA